MGWVKFRIAFFRLKTDFSQVSFQFSLINPLTFHR